MCVCNHLEGVAENTFRKLTPVSECHRCDCKIGKLFINIFNNSMIIVIVINRKLAENKYRMSEELSFSILNSCSANVENVYRNIEKISIKIVGVNSHQSFNETCQYIYIYIYILNNTSYDKLRRDFINLS